MSFLPGGARSAPEARDGAPASRGPQNRPTTYCPGRLAWESPLLLANGHDITRAKPGARVDRVKLRQIDLHWHDLRHEGACRLLGDGVDIRTIQLMLGHADIKQTQRYLNITDEELRRSMTGLWERRRQLKAVSQQGADMASRLYGFPSRSPTRVSRAAGGDKGRYETRSERVLSTTSGQYSSKIRRSRATSSGLVK